MPIYEFSCDDCGAEFAELVMRAADQVNVKCQSCGSDNITKLLSGSAVRSVASKSECKYAPPGGCHGGGCGCH